MSLFDETARKRIAQTVAEIEKRTAAELVVVSVPHSDDYEEVRLASALAAALAGAATAHLVWPQLTAAHVLWVEFGLALLVYLLAGLPVVLRLATPRGRAQSSVERRAREAFLDHHVFDTRDRTGVLIFISELEHRVVIIGDKGIHARVQPEGWQAHVQCIVVAIRQGRAADGVCEVLRALGEVLVGHFPPRADDTNELSDAMR